MKINIHNIIGSDISDVTNVWILVTNTTTGPTPVVVYFCVDINDIKEGNFYNIDDAEIKGDIKLKYVMEINGHKHTKFKSIETKSTTATYIHPTVVEDGFIEADLRKSAGWEDVFPKETYINKAIYYNLEILSEDVVERLLSPIEIDSTGILTLKNGIVSNRGLVYSEDMKERYIELTRFNNIELLQKNKSEISMYNTCGFDKKCITNTDYIGGRCLNLFPLFSNKNYCHGLLDMSVMLNILEKSKTDITNFDWYIIPKNNYKLSKKLLKIANIPNNKILHTGFDLIDDKHVSPNKNIMFDELVSPSLDGCYCWYRPNGFEYIRKAFLNFDIKPSKKFRLYLTRENSGRDISNITEFENLIEKYGFEPIDCSVQYNLPSIISEASVVIGAHGAAMANCVFCSPGSILIDLLPEYHTKQYFSSVSQSIDMKYIGVICKEHKQITEKSSNNTIHSSRSFEVDIPLLKKLLDKL